MGKNNYSEIKEIIREKILSSVNVFCSCLTGKCFMYVFDDNSYIEVFYNKSSFSHLTGVDTYLTANDFYKKAKNNILTTSQFYFNENTHPYDLARKKTNRLSEIDKFVNSDLIVLKELSTSTVTYKFALSSTDLTLCFVENLDKITRKKIDQYYIPASFRVGDDSVNKCLCYNTVTHIFMKSNKNLKYHTLNYGELNSIQSFPKVIKNLLDINKLLNVQETV